MAHNDVVSAPTLTQRIIVAGVETTITGSAADLYVRDAQAHASALTSLFEYARSMLKIDDIVIDVGANIGLSTIGLARLVPDGHVFAFEPSRLNALSLRANLAQNDIGNVSVIEAAASAAAGRAHLIDSFNYGAGSHVGLAAAKPNVATIDLDTFAVERGLTTVAFIKIDVEGHEPWVLAGAKSLIEAAKPKIWLEFNAWCLTAFGKVQPLAFAEVLFQTFTARVVKGRELIPVGDTIRFLHDNMAVNSCVTDLLLELREYRRIPASLGVFDAVGQDVRLEDENAGLRRRHAELESAIEGLKHSSSQLELVIESLKRSSSWRITRPLRALFGGTE